MHRKLEGKFNKSPTYVLPQKGKKDTLANAMKIKENHYNKYKHIMLATIRQFQEDTTRNSLIIQEAFHFTFPKFTTSAHAQIYIIS